MEIIEEVLIYENKLDMDILDGNMAFFDIETTGLSRDRDIVYLVGVLYFNRDRDDWILRQYFANEMIEEIQVLVESINFLKTFDLIVNYNGNSFDIPFLNHRARLMGLDLELDRDRSLDIYAIVRKNKAYLDLENLKLTSLERYLGINREDIYSGRDCIDFYKDYILSANPILKERILKHNYDDLYYLREVIKILDILDERKTIALSEKHENLGLFIDEIKLSNDYLVIEGILKGRLPEDIYHYGDNYKIYMKEEGLMEISFEVRRGLVSPEEKSLFIVNNDFNIEESFANDYGYGLPANISIMTIDKAYMIDNIKKFLSILIGRLI